MDFPILGGIGRCEPRGQSRSEALVDGLEGTLSRCWSAESAPERALEPAISIELEDGPSSIELNGAAAYLRSMVIDVGRGCDGEREAWKD